MIQHTVRHAPVHRVGRLDDVKGILPRVCKNFSNVQKLENHISSDKNPVLARKTHTVVPFVLGVLAIKAFRRP